MATKPVKSGIPKKRRLPVESASPAPQPSSVQRIKLDDGSKLATSTSVVEAVVDAPLKKKNTELISPQNLKKQNWIGIDGKAFNIDPVAHEAAAPLIKDWGGKVCSDDAATLFKSALSDSALQNAYVGELAPVFDAQQLASSGFIAFQGHVLDLSDFAPGHPGKPIYI